MAAVDYAGFIRAIRTTLSAQPELANVRIYLEEDPQFGLPDQGIAIAIYLLGRTPHPRQILAAGKRTRFLVKVAVTCFGMSLERFEQAEANRDALLSNVEMVLQRDRTFGGKVDMAWIEGGDFASAKAPGGICFVAAADTIIIADASSITT